MLSRRSSKNDPHITYTRGWGLAKKTLTRPPRRTSARPLPPGGTGGCTGWGEGEFGCGFAALGEMLPVKPKRARGLGVFYLLLAATLGCGAKQQDNPREEPAFPYPYPEAVEWAPSGESFFAVGVDYDAKASAVFRLTTDGERLEVYRTGRLIHTFSLSPTGDHFATINDLARSRKVRVWETASGNSETIFESSRDTYFPLHNGVSPWDAQGRWLAFYTSFYQERTLYLGDVKEGTSTELTTGWRVDRAFWSGGGKLIVPLAKPIHHVSEKGGDVILGYDEFDPVSATRTVHHSSPSGFQIIFPFSSRRVAFLKNPGFSLLELDSWRSRPIDLPPVRFFQIAWSPDSGRFAFPVNDEGGGEIRLFDVGENRSESVLERVGWRVDDLAWSPSGRYLAFSIRHHASFAQNKVCVLDFESGEVIEIGKRHLHLKRVLEQRLKPSILWNPTRDELIWWNMVVPIDGPPWTEFYAVDVGGIDGTALQSTDD